MKKQIAALSKYRYGLAALMLVVPASVAHSQPVTDVGPLPRHDVENEHVIGLLDQSNFRFVGRSNPQGPYSVAARNWTDLYGYTYDGTDPQFAGKQYAYVSTGGFTRRGNFTGTHRGGVAIFDVTADTDPTYLGTYLPPCAGPGNCSFLIRDVEIHDGIAYFSSDRPLDRNGGVFVADLRDDPANPTHLSQLNFPNNGGLSPVHEIGLDVVSPTEAYLYANDSTTTGTVNVYDISDPRNTPITRVADLLEVSTHGVYADNGTLFVAGNAKVTVFDVSDIGNGNFTELGEFTTPGGFTHSSWSDTYVNDAGETRNVIYLTHEMNGTDLQVWDVTDILNPAEGGTAEQIATVSNIDLALQQGTGDVTNSHNVFLVDDLLFTSWTAAGMVVINVADPENPFVIDTFDTNEAESTSNFVGAFGVNPSLGLDRVLISDRANGLWVVDVSDVVPEPALMAYLAAILTAFGWWRGRGRSTRT